MLVQDRDSDVEERGEWQVVSERRPTEAEWQELSFAWKVCKHVRSNAIVLSRDLATVGHRGGSDEPRRLGQASRWRSPSPTSTGGAMASDAYFPFPDGPQLAIDAGITVDHPARRFDPGPRRGRRYRRRRGRDGVHQPSALPALTGPPEDDVVRLGGDPPSPWEGEFGFCRVVRAGDLVLVGGTTSVDPNGAVLGVTPYEQTIEILEEDRARARARGGRPGRRDPDPLLRDRHLALRRGRPGPRRGVRARSGR